MSIPIIGYCVFIAVCIGIEIYFILVNKKQAKLKSDYQKLLSQKKSSEVMIGLITEKLAPFLDDFNHNPEDLQFMGNPIDYVHFNRETGDVTFIEVKSGNSKLSKVQRLIRNAVNEGRVAFNEFRVP